jgi:acyl dehydratase
MPELCEKLWEYDVIEPGQEGTLTEVAITADNICAYALTAQNHDRRYLEPGQNPEYPKAVVAMPTMVLTYAPLLRYDIAAHSGFVALEASTTARRQTPFAKCEIRWYRPVMAGDTITGSRRVLDKYERRGNRFITFRVEASNQHGAIVAAYDYSCIFDYAKGRKALPTAQGPAANAAPHVLPGRPVAAAARLLRFDDAAPGTPLARLQVTENVDTIIRKNDLRLAGKPDPSNIHTDEAYARQNLFGGMVNAGPATMSYVDQMLQLSFPLRSFYDGGSLLMRAIEPFRAGDVMTLQGEVTAKRIEDEKRLVTCRIRGVNQRGDLVCLADATLNLPE